MSFITREEAVIELQRLVNGQLEVLGRIQSEARALVGTLADSTEVALSRERAEAARAVP